MLEESRDHGQALQSIDLVAGQLGWWDAEKLSFKPLTWVAPPGAVVSRVIQNGPTGEALPSTRLRVGHIPKSGFPIHIGTDDAVTHNTAVIGVTGSGKSYLSLWLIEGALRAGVRVLILDVSRQHWSFLMSHDPFPIRVDADVDTWLTSDKPLAVYQFAASTNYPTTTANMVEKVLSHLEQLVTLRPGINEPARVWVVFEEAHSLIPEWNQVAARNDPEHVNRTARTILQGRKYGMGCLIISQRTANITKTILNQCNTIFALQSFDQTGLDFLSNYMGTAYANVITTLPARHAVLVGKASSSTRPVIFEVEDLASTWIAADPP